ncbi:TPA: DUF2591 family protein [Morganella morganii]|nr:DUF2591 family protein [Morganella morganii]
MNKYRDKSYFEINKAVAECKYGIGCTGKTQGGDVIVFTDSFTAVFDPCNNPADAMPIIIENGISSLFNGDEWICSALDGEFLSINENLYRAGCEVFLMMKDAENETNT